MDQRKSIGLLGSGLLLLGVFAPLVSLPFGQSITYVQNGRGDGMIVLGMAALAALLAATGRYRALLLPGLISAGTIILTYSRISQIISSLQDSAGSGLRDNPFRGLVDAAMQSMQMQWGWAPLILGALLVIVAGLIKGGVKTLPCPHCQDLVEVLQPSCPHCEGGIFWNSGRPFKKSRPA